MGPTRSNMSISAQGNLKVRAQFGQEHDIRNREPSLSGWFRRRGGFECAQLSGHVIPASWTVEIHDSAGHDGLFEHGAGDVVDLLPDFFEKAEQRFALTIPSFSSSGFRFGLCRAFGYRRSGKQILLQVDVECGILPAYPFEHHGCMFFLFIAIVGEYRTQSCHRS